MSVMTSPDEAGASGGVPKPPPSGSLPVPAEPMPAENRRLPKADSRPAPVFALLRARWPWLVIAALIGTVIGLLLGAAQNYQSTAVIRLLGVNDSQRVKQVGQTVEFMATSPAVMSEAATKLGVKSDDLSRRTTAVWETDTDLVKVTVRNRDGQKAYDGVKAVANAVITTNTKNTQNQLLNTKTEYNNMVANEKLTSVQAEGARITQIGQLAAQAQAGILGAVSVQVASEPTGYQPAGASRPISAALGGAGGLLLGALAALVAGAGRRRLRSPAELQSLAPELTLKSTTQAGEVAGRLLESGHSTLVVLSLPSTPSSASRFAAAVANHLRTHGSSVTLVNAIALESGDTSSMALPDEVWVLRRDIRQDVKAYFSTDVLVVACTAEPEAVGLISGQSDLMAVVVAKEGRSTLQQVWDTVGAVEKADPIVVLAP